MSKPVGLEEHRQEWMGGEGWASPDDLRAALERGIERADRIMLVMCESDAIALGSEVHCARRAGCRTHQFVLVGVLHRWINRVMEEA